MRRPMSAIGKESVAHSHSRLESLFGGNSGQGFSVYGRHRRSDWRGEERTAI